MASSPTGAITSQGIGSGLDIQSIVTKLMQVESQPLINLQTRDAGLQTKISTYGGIKSGLTSLQSKISALGDATSLQTMNAISSDSSIFTASSDVGAAAGAYNINVTSLAKAQSIMTSGQSSASSVIGDGTSTTLSFNFGTISGGTVTSGVYTGASFTQDASSSTKTITIDSSNNTLQGIRDAINKAGIGVTATIVNDGGTSPYRLVLVGPTGANNSMNISVNGNSAIQNLLGYDVTKSAGSGQNLVQNDTAQNAALTINGVSISSASNTIQNNIDKITLTLKNTGNTVLNVTKNTSSMVGNVGVFVKSYNDLVTTINQATDYDSSTKKASPLTGDYAANSIISILRKKFTEKIVGLPEDSTIRTLSDVGISFKKDGTLAVDNTKLQKALDTNTKDVISLFSAFGQPTDSLVSYNSSTKNSKAGIYNINISRLATQGTSIGNVDVSAGKTITANVNDKLTLTVNDTSTIVSLIPGNYTASTLTTMIQAAVNGNQLLKDKNISVNVGTDTNNFIKIMAKNYGSTSKVAVDTTASAGLALFGTSTNTDGVDVAGSIGGITATGDGQVLSATDSSDAYGIKLSILGGNTGARGTIAYSTGFAKTLNTVIDGLSSLIDNAISGTQATVKTIAKQEQVVQARLQQIQDGYTRKFNALDTAIGQLKSQSEMVTQQLSAISNSNK